MVTDMNQQTSQIAPRSRRQSGFTLVEMLISVTLVLLMMTLFTSIFEMATTSLSTQRGIASMDQAARALTTAFRGDVAKRTYTYVQPYYPTEAAGNSPTPFGNRAGYIYISTNSPYSGLDDLLQFTVNSSLTDEELDTTEFFGASRLFYDIGSDTEFNGGGGDAERQVRLASNPNQPEADDASLRTNEFSSSPAAEVCYFVRNGGLYRRVMLLREPLPVAGQDLSITPLSAVSGNNYVQPTSAPTDTFFGGTIGVVASPLSIQQFDDSAADHFLLGAGSPGERPPVDWDVRATNDLWRYFDYSAVPTLGTMYTPSGGIALPNGASFIGIDALDNTGGPGSSLLGGQLGSPLNRFGFDYNTGFSREHDRIAEMLFIGRFTQGETSDPRFNFPMAPSREDDFANEYVNVPLQAGQTAAIINTGALELDGDVINGNPMDLIGTPLRLNENGVIHQFSGTDGRGGVRHVEDLLLSNVHSFRVKLWDSRLQRFVTPSHSDLAPLSTPSGIQTVVGDYHSNRNLNATYGPHGARVAAGDTTASADNHVFDTSHPWSPQQAPFVPYRYYPPRAGDGPGVAGGTSFPVGPGPTPNTSPDPYTEFDRETGINQKNKGYWVPSDFSDADPGNWVNNEYAVGDVVFRPFVDVDGNNVFSWTADNVPAQAFQIAYVCVQAGYAGETEPSWPSVAGQRFGDVSNALASGTPAVWVSLDNRQPLRAIQATVQFFDPNTEKTRQLTLEMPLTTDR